MKWRFHIIDVSHTPGGYQVLELENVQPDFEEMSDFTAKLRTTKAIQQLGYMPATAWVETPQCFYRLTIDDKLIKLFQMKGADNEAGKA